MLREEYIQLQREMPSMQILADKQKVIQNLTNQIVQLSSEISTLKSQSSVSINVSTHFQDYQTKLTEMNSRIQ